MPMSVPGTHVSASDGLIGATIDALPRWLRVDRRFGVIDAALLVVTALMFLTSYTVLLFHVVFVLLTLGAFYWRLRQFTVRTALWAGAASSEVVAAVVTNRTQVEELIEIPMLTSILILVFLIAAQRARVQTQLAHLSLHDALTKLPNRTLFVSRLHEALSLSGNRDETFAVLYVDLDGFKSVNDRLGHAAGDALLVEVASRLHGLVRLTDTVARLGGDEFALILRETSPSGASAAAERIVEAVQEAILIEGETVSVSASVGIALSASRETARADELLRHADAAMYQEKAIRKARGVTPPAAA